MLKNISRLQVSIQDKIYSFDCEPGSSIDHVKNALNAFIAYAVQIEQQVQAQQLAAKEKEELASDILPIEG